MPPPRSQPADDPTWSLEVVSPGHDFIVRCKVQDQKWIENGAIKPEFGTEPEQASLLADYVLCGIKTADEVGWHFLYYAKNRAAQWAYNAEHSEVLGDELPVLRYTWVVPRGPYLAGGTVQAIPPGQMPTFGGTYTWALAGKRMDRLPPELDGMFVQVVHEYYDTTHPLRIEEVDKETGEVRSITRALVPRGTVGHAIDKSGELATYEAINSRHGWLVTRKANGGAGSMVNGRKVILTRGVKPHFWPKVLDYIGLTPIYANSGNVYSAILEWIVRKVFRCEDYNAECRITRVKRYTTKQPQFGGRSDWSTLFDDEAADLEFLANQIEDEDPEAAADLREQAAELRAAVPDIPEPLPLLERSIEFRGKNLTVLCEACLRQDYFFYDEGVTEFFQGSSPTQWPESRLADVEVYQEDGAWVTEMLFVDAPDGPGRSSGLDLTQKGEARTTAVDVAWTPAKDATGPVATRMDVAVDAKFESGFLLGFRDKAVTPATNSAVNTWATITGLQRGTPYFVRVRTAAYVVAGVNYPALTSNTLVIMGSAEPELELRKDGNAVADGSTINVGNVELGETGRITLDLASIGLQTVRSISASITGTGDEVFSLDDPPISLSAGQTASVELRFTPAAIGSITATLKIQSEVGDMEYTLQGLGIAPELTLEQPAGTDRASGSTLAFGTVTSLGISKTFKLRNTGNAPLRGPVGDPLRKLALTLSGPNAGDWSVTSDLTADSIAAGGFLNFTLRFLPLDDGSGANRSAVLSIASNDADESPFTLNLTGSSLPPTAPGAVDTAFNVTLNGDVLAVALMPNGKIVIGGNFTTVNGMAQNYLARLNADGTHDMSWLPTPNAEVRAIAVDSQDVVYIGGAFTTVNGTARGHLARLDNVGVLDGWTADANGDVECLMLDESGNLYAGGTFSVVESVGVQSVVKINSSGGVDLGFIASDIPTGATVRGLAFDAAGRVLVVGDWGGSSSTPPSSTPPSSTPPSSTPPSSTPPSSTPPSSTPPSSTPPSSTPPSSTPPSSTPPSSTPPSSTPPSSTPPSSTPPSSTPPSSTPPSSTPPSSTPPSSTPPSSTPPSSTPPSSTPPSSTP